MTQQRVALVMAGGTGGHIFPGLALAEALRARDWRVHWLGAPDSMESRLVPPRGFAFETIAFSGLRGKGALALAFAPLRLLRAFWQSLGVLRRLQPQVVVGLGGYISFPAGMMAVLLNRPLVLHEQNSVAGLANKVLAGVADAVFTAFDGALKNGLWVGNPLRAEFSTQPSPAERFAGRGGPLRLLVVGGSLGAQALNDVVPRALALLPVESRPIVTHQSGEKQLEALRAGYAATGVTGTLLPFIDDMASAWGDADLVICRAGASTVTEIASVGAAAVFVPFPHAVDDHQTHNARFLCERGAGWLLPQTELSAERLAELLARLDRPALLQRAQAAHQLAQRDATGHIVAACERLAARNTGRGMAA